MKWVLAALAICAGQPLWAQDRMTASQCDATQAVIAELAGQTAVMFSNTAVAADGWCEAENIIIEVDARSALKADGLRWRASGIERLIEQGLPPLSLDVQLEGIRVRPQMDDPVLDYLLEVQSRPAGVDASLSVRWDGVQNAVFVDELRAEFDESNAVVVSARIDGVDLSDAAGLQTSFGSAGVRDLSITADFDGWFETVLVLPLGSQLLTAGDVSPREQVADLQRQAAAFVGTLPEASMPDRAKTALNDFVMALPEPRGRLQVQLSAEPTLGAASVLRATMSASDPASMIVAVLEGVTILATWTPEAAQ